MKIEWASESDTKKIVAIDDVARRDSERRQLIDKAIAHKQCFVARNDADLCGYLIFHNHFFNHCFIELLMVDSSRRRQGIGTLLVRHFETFVGNTKIFTSTNQSNTEMRRLLARLNYLESGVVHNLDEDDPEIVYFKNLA